MRPKQFTAHMGGILPFTLKIWGVTVIAGATMPLAPAADLIVVGKEATAGVSLLESIATTRAVIQHLTEEQTEEDEPLVAGITDIHQ